MNKEQAERLIKAIEEIAETLTKMNSKLDRIESNTGRFV